MKWWLQFILAIVLTTLGVCTIIGVATLVSYYTYGAADLDTFNKLNNTSYTIEQWRIYRYEIEKLHPFNEVGK